jgi:ribonuclease H / adenosylcobalamin/alpha-ribazole phosphatase
MNQFSNTKEKIKEEILKVVSKKSYVISSTIVGSFIGSKGLEGISDIDVIIITENLNEEKFNNIIKSFSRIRSKSIGLEGYEVYVNSTFGPLKFNSEKKIVFHVMIYDINGHIKHVEESPFTCHNWENFTPILGLPLKEIYPVINLQFSDLFDSRRGLTTYLKDIEKGVITFRKYQFKKNTYEIEKNEYKLDNLHAIEYSYHIIYNLLNNFYKIISGSKESLSPDEIISTIKKLKLLDLEQISFSKEVLIWKHNKLKKKPEDIFKRTRIFITNFFKIAEKVKKISLYTRLIRHGRTELNDSSFLGIGRDPKLAEKINVKNNKIYERGYSSQLKRSKETLKYFNCKTIYESEYLNEINYGLAEGLTLNKLSKMFPEISKSWGEGGDPCFPQGESQGDVLKRVEKFLEKFNFDKRSIIVTHLVVLRVFLYLFTDLNRINLYKIRIPHLQGYEIQIFNNYKNVIFYSTLRTEIRKQLSIKL